MVRLVLAIGLLLVVGGTATACSTSPGRSTSAAPVLPVAAGLYPLAEAARLVGGAKAAVTDVVPAGADPMSYVPPAGALDTFRREGLVVDIGGGFQPGFEAAAAGATRLLELGPANPYVWLDPATMAVAVQRIAGAMEAADPGAAPLFRENSQSLVAEIRSTDIDFSSTLSTCPRTTFVTAGSAFSTMATHYGLVDKPAGTDPAPSDVAALAAQIRSSGLPAVFAETWTDGSGAARVAAAAGVKVRVLDTLAGPPAGGWPRGTTYLTLMERNLGSLGSVLGCPVEQQ